MSLKRRAFINLSALAAATSFVGINSTKAANQPTAENKFPPLRMIVRRAIRRRVGKS